MPGCDQRHDQWRSEAIQAQARLERPHRQRCDRDHWALACLRLLDGAGHTTSLVECINGLLKSFLNSRQSFRNLQTLQAYLDLFVLWHNMRAYQRGKRRGQSPYQIAGINPGSTTGLNSWAYPVS